jgi:hypothetical protein
LSTPITRVEVRSTATSISRRIWRIFRTLSAKSETTIELRLAVIDPSRLTNGPQRLDRLRRLDAAHPEDLGDEGTARPRCERPTGADEAAPAIGCTRSAPPDVGTATKPFARSVDRNNSKYSDRLSGRSQPPTRAPARWGR